MFFQDCPISLRIKFCVYIANHVAGGIAGHGVKDFGIGRVGKVVQQPYGIAVEKPIDSGVIDVIPAFQLCRAPDHRA